MSGTRISDMTATGATAPLAAGLVVPAAYAGANYKYDFGAFALRSVSVDDYGAVGNGTTNDATALQTALTATASGVLRLTPGKTYRIDSTITAANSDVTIDARGAIITSPLTTSAAVLSISGNRVKVLGGTWKLTAGDDDPWFFNVTGTDCEIDGVRFVKTPDAGGYHNYFRHTADGLVVRGCRMEGSNGNYIECSNAAFLGNALIGRTSGGDDCFALKAISDSCRNIRIEGNYIENLASGLSIGSEIGVLGADDATYSRTVGQVVFTGNTLKNCYGIAFIKPGGIGGSDYRDGTVEDVAISNNTLIDESGTKFERGIAITPGRGARVRNVRGRNNIIRARSAGGAGRLVGGIDRFILDYAGGTTAATVSDCSVEVDYIDPWNGVANGVGGAPGNPVTFIDSTNRAGAVGSFSNIIINTRGNGSAEAGIVVGSSITSGEVKVGRVHLTQVNVSNAAGQGGAHLLSAVYLGSDGYWSVTPAAGTELSATSVSFLSQITSKDSAVTATGPAEVFPSVANITIDVDSNEGRILANQTGFGYRDIGIYAANILLKPGGGSLTATVDSTSLNLASGKFYKINSVQVVGPRETGWSADTGTAKKTANATYTPGSLLPFGAAYTEAELDAAATRIQTIENAVRDISQTQKSIKDALIAHGLIGT